MKNLLFLICLMVFFQSFSQNNSVTYLFVGSYTEWLPDTGIYIYEFNNKNGELKKTGEGLNLVNPSWISLSPNGKYLYACTETKMPGNGNVSAFAVDSVNGKINFLNKWPSKGENPVYNSIDKSNKWLVNANYTEGTLSTYKINSDGSLDSASQVFSFADSSILKQRQDKSHLHAAVFSPDGKFVLAPDLGADKIRIFEVQNSGNNFLKEAALSFAKTLPGHGPRHITFHPFLQRAYCIEELSGTISVYKWNNGQLDSIQYISSYSQIRDAYAGADIHISPDGKFLYASNRLDGANTIAIFLIDIFTGKLTLKGHQSTFGDHPRNFTIDPTGKFLLVANTGTGNIVVFSRNKKTGLLKKTKTEIQIPGASCLQMKKYIIN